MGSRILEVADTDSTWTAFESESLFVMADELTERYGGARLLLDVSHDGALAYVAFAVPGGYVALGDERMGDSAYAACRIALSEQCPDACEEAEQVDECPAWPGLDGALYVPES
jgi:hypothetical protein